MADKPLSGVDQWMVKRNLEYAKERGVFPVLANLRAQGYDRVANAVEQVAFAEWMAVVNTNLAYVAPIEEFPETPDAWQKQFASGMRPTKAAAIAIDAWQAALKFKHS